MPMPGPELGHSSTVSMLALPLPAAQGWVQGRRNPDPPPTGLCMPWNAASPPASGGSWAGRLTAVCLCSHFWKVEIVPGTKAVIVMGSGLTVVLNTGFGKGKGLLNGNPYS